MYQVIIAIHVLLGLGIIGLVMMQQGKGADAGASFGSGSAGSVFGAQGAASFLSRTTAILATLFFITSLGLAVINGHKGAAYDIMNTPAAGDAPSVPGTSTMPSIPGIPSTPGVDTTTSNMDDVVKPPSMSQTAAEAKAAIPAAVEPPKAETTAVPAKEATIEKIEVPKAEPIKTVDEKKEPEKHGKHEKQDKHGKHEKKSSKHSSKTKADKKA
ncbi:Protein translocase subunit secG [Crenothrix polyspora]|uniref:Protein-export membrane protein SecG n=1 Tax=Crenothrix polyspora TaxID=360316 RepID=A0A1R4HJ84_9GAMM|nr:preprotein translocase subunit SecG [Crenothrix polyspora]SJM96269.1 Protein translocase subunit secG [Crenothrix polyspora]